MTDVEKMLNEWAYDIDLFAREALGFIASSQQLAVFQDINNGVKDIAVKSGHGTGKTTLLAIVIIWVGLFKYDSKIPATAPTAPQLIRLLLPEVRKWRDALPVQLKEAITVKSDSISFTTGNICIPRTARKEAPEGLQGFHATFLTWIIDEASGVPNIIFEVIDGSLTGDNHLRIMTANPTRTDGFFYDAFHTNRSLWSCHTFNAEDSENVSKSSVDRKRIQYGIDSDAYRVRVLGEFPRGNTNAVIPLYIIEDAQSREEYNTTGAEIWGLDYADAGDDNTILVKRTGNYFYEKVKCPVSGSHRQELTMSWLAVQYSQAKKKPKAIFVDAIGEGSGLISAANRPVYKNVPVVPVKVSWAADDTDLYFNKRTELYYRLKEALEDEGRLMHDDSMVGELSAQEFTFTTKGQLQLIPKKDIKESLGRSPDIADAMALTCQTQMFAVEAPIDELNDFEFMDDYDEVESLW